MHSSVTVPIDELPAAAELGACSGGILAIPRLSAFFGGRVCRSFGSGPVGGVLGWGNKRSGLKARREAGRRGIPLALLEDGFMRSAGLGKLGAPPLSLVVDDIGMYFDARQPSRLERLLGDVGWLTPALLREAELGLERWREERLTKYNTGVDRPPDHPGRRYVLLIDQVRGDASVAGALASPQSFQRAFDEALATHGADRLAVRSHPDVTAGRAHGYLAVMATAAGVRLLDPAITAHAALDGADEVWTVSSAIGFEALLRGIAVRTYGVPFYAGFGRTEDKALGADAALQRRAVARTPLEMFAAAYLVYARYADPVTGRTVRFDQAVDRLIDWRRRSGELAAAPTTAFGFSRWKRASAAVFLGGASKPVAFVGKARPRALARAHITGARRIAVWGTTDAAGFSSAVAEAELPLVRVEDGFIRSVGLGSDLQPAGSLVLDDLGIYYDARTPSRLEALLQDAAAFPAPLVARACALRERLVSSGTTKYNLGTATADLATMAQGRPIALVTEQVPGDASLRYGAGAVTTNLELLRAVRLARPDACVVYKEHPDVVAGNRKGRLAAASVRAYADAVVSDGDIATLFASAQEVHVISSLAGFEALCRGVRVVVWGKPFYAGWGLTEDRETLPRRTRRVTLDELVAATLILYPRYIEPVSGVPCAVEAFLDSLDMLRASGPPPRQSRLRRQVARMQRWLTSLR